MTHRDEQERIEFSVASGGAADMDGRAAQPETDANERYGHVESKKTQKFVFRSVLGPNRISFSHDQDPELT